MLKKAIQAYYKFFDETVSSSTFIVLMISCLIFAAGSISPSANADNYTWDIRQAMSNDSWVNTVVIDGIEYQLKFTKVASK